MNKLIIILGVISSLCTIYLTILWKDFIVLFVTIVAASLFILGIVKILKLVKSDLEYKSYMKGINVYVFLNNLIWLILCALIIIKGKEYNGQIYVLAGCFVFYSLHLLRKKVVSRNE